jgi:hypothetical protein
MLTIRGIYDGQTINLLEHVAVKQPRHVIISFLDELEGDIIDNSINEKFELLFEQWYIETALLSGKRVYENPNYQKMVALGKPIIPLLLKKLEIKPCYLFNALEKLTGEDPVLKEHSTDFEMIKSDWLTWGKEKGYI